MTPQRVEAEPRSPTRAIISATGTQPRVPPIDGLAGTPYWTNRDAVSASGVSRTTEGPLPFPDLWSPDQLGARDQLPMGRPSDTARASTRARIWSRTERTPSRSMPEGSSRSQSSYRLPG